MLRAGAEEAQRFAREARVMRQLSHPGIVRYVADGATPDGAQWLAMEWLEGEDLAATLSRGPMASQDALSACIAIADALEAAHALGFVHRDLKPSNVFLVGGDPKQAKLIDFGIVRRVQAQLTAAHTMAGVFVGSPGYMAPERITASSQIDGRADVFSLGCVLFRCLTGRPAFSGEHLTALLAKVLLEEAPRLSDFVAAPAALDALVARMLSKDAAGRPATAAEVARQLRALGPVALGEVRARESTRAMEREQLWLCVLMVDAKPAPAGDVTKAFETVGQEAVSIAQVAEASGARLVGTVGCTHILLWEGAGAPADMARRAARAALSIQAALPSVALGLASGRAAVNAAVPVGAALERAAGCVKRSVGQIVIDDGLAQMLEPTFAVTRSDGEATLVGERTLASDERALLGRPTSCFGREVELATLSAVLSECIDDGAATAVIVTGGAGVGKSRVRHEWVKSLRASHPEAQVWSAQGDAMREGGSFGVAAALVEDACGVGIGMPRAEVQRRIAERVASCVAAPEQKRVASRLSEMCGAGWEVEVDEALRQARREPVVMGDQLRAAWEDFLVASCTLCPVVLVVDDVQWADRPSVELLDRALRNFRKLPWMVLAVGRPDYREKFPNLWSERGAREIAVPALKERSAERLVLAALGATLAPDRVAAIVDRGAGNPYFLEELIRAESEGRGGEVPETVLAMVESRLLRLDAESRRVLRAASVLGAQVDARGVSAVLGGPPSRRRWKPSHGQSSSRPYHREATGFGRSPPARPRTRSLSTRTARSVTLAPRRGWPRRERKTRRKSPSTSSAASSQRRPLRCGVSRRSRLSGATTSPPRSCAPSGRWPRAPRETTSRARCWPRPRRMSGEVRRAPSSRRGKLRSRSLATTSGCGRSLWSPSLRGGWQTPPCSSSVWTRRSQHWRGVQSARPRSWRRA